MAMNIINKYVWLVETIYRARMISFEDINRKWLDDEDFSKGVDLPIRTFHKWRIAVEDIFGLIIDNEKHGEYRYYIANEDEITKGGMCSWMFNTISTSNMLLENKSLNDRILLEDVPSGREHLQPIITAMKKNRLIHFTYYNYWRDDYRQHCVEPYCVKLFHQRWYMVGKMLGANVVLVYSLDRMSEFRMSERTYQYPNDFDGECFFENCFGGNTTDGQGQRYVTRRFSPYACPAPGSFRFRIYYAYRISQQPEGKQ